MHFELQLGRAGSVLLELEPGLFVVVVVLLGFDFAR